MSRAIPAAPLTLPCVPVLHLLPHVPCLLLLLLLLRYFIIRAASECQQALQRGSGEGPSYPIEVSAKFVRPVVLPAEVDFHVYEDGNKEGSTDSSSRLRYQVKTKNGKVAVDGSFVCNVQSQ